MYFYRIIDVVVDINSYIIAKKKKKIYLLFVAGFFNACRIIQLIVLFIQARQVLDKPCDLLIIGNNDVG